jgi:hypothetical protein
VGWVRGNRNIFNCGLNYSINIFFLGVLVNMKRHDIVEILLKLALNNNQSVKHIYRRCSTYF